MVTRMSDVAPVETVAVPGERAADSHRRFPLWTIVFGIVLPLGCLYADPVVFTSTSMGGRPLVAAIYRIPAYAFFAFEFVSLAIWLGFRKSLARWAGLFSGALWLGASGALALGIVMLPLTVIGLIIVIGVLGLVPFGTAAVYARQAATAWSERRPARSNAGHVLLLVAGLTLPTAAIAGPFFFVRGQVHQAIAQLAGNSEPGERDRAQATLEKYFPCVDLRELATASHRADADGRRRLDAVHVKMTGLTIEEEERRRD